MPKIIWIPGLGQSILKKTSDNSVIWGGSDSTIGFQFFAQSALDLTLNADGTSKFPVYSDDVIPSAARFRGFLNEANTTGYDVSTAVYDWRLSPQRVVTSTYLAQFQTPCHIITFSNGVNIAAQVYRLLKEKNEEQNIISITVIGGPATLSNGNWSAVRLLNANGEIYQQLIVATAFGRVLQALIYFGRNPPTGVNESARATFLKMAASWDGIVFLCPETPNINNATWWHDNHINPFITQATLDFASKNRLDLFPFLIPDGIVFQIYGSELMTPHGVRLDTPDGDGTVLIEEIGWEKAPLLTMPNIMHTDLLYQEWTSKAAIQWIKYHPNTNLIELNDRGYVVSQKNIKIDNDEVLRANRETVITYYVPPRPLPDPPI